MERMNGLNDSTVPPPSTLAAQIVDNLSRQRTQSESTVNLQDLLADFLSAGAAAFVDTSVEAKCQLIDLLLKACRQAYRPSNPFDADPQKIENILQSLKVIELTVKHSPDVLLFSQTSEGNVLTKPSSPRGPLALWMIPQILLFLHDSHDAAIPNAACGILQACMHAELRSVNLRRSYRPVTLLLQGCTRDFLEQLSHSTTSISPGATTEVRFPSEETVVEASLSAGQNGFPREVLRLAYAQILCIVVRILRVILSIAKKSKGVIISYLDVLKTISTLIRDLTNGKAQSLLPSKDPYLFVELLLVLSELLRVFSSPIRPHRCMQQASSEICHLIKHIIADESSALGLKLEQQLCWALHLCLSTSLASNRNREAISRSFESSLRQLIEQPKSWSNYSVDLQLTVVISCSIVLGIEGFRDPQLLEKIQNQELKIALTKQIDSVQPSNAQSTPALHPAKRLRIAHDQFHAKDESSRLRLSNILSDNGIAVIDQRTFQLARDAWRQLLDASVDLQIHIIDAIDHAICDSNHADADGVDVCPLADQSEHTTKGIKQALLDSMYSLVTHLVTVHPDQKNPIALSPTSRIHALHCLGRILAHTSNPSHLDLSSSEIGKWCIHSLGSKKRDVRSAAGKTFKQYVRSRVDRQICRRNRLAVLDLLRKFTGKNSIAKDETTIWVLSQLLDGNPGEDEMLLILFRLVEYLGHSHPLINALAYGELLRLSSNSSYRARKILDPYWRFISSNIVKDMIRRPSAIQRLCDLLEMPVEAFISMTRIHTVPYLVLTKRVDVIERIAAGLSATSPSNTTSPVVDACINAEQLPGLLAFLLIHAPSDPHPFITSTLCAISEDFSRINVSDLVRSDPVKIAFEIFRYAGDGESKQLTQAQAAISFVAEQSQSRHVGSGRRSSRKLDSLGIFFENHSLAVLKLLSDIVTEVHSAQVMPERRRCLAGIKYMISIGGDHAVGAVPQISACLRSATSNSDLCEEAFEAWIILLQNLSDVSGLIHPTFALIRHHWDGFGSVTQQRAHELLRSLFAERQDLMQELACTLPSLEGISLLSKYESDIAKRKESKDPKRALSVFVERLSDGDPLVVMRALEELRSFLKENQSFLQDSSLSERPDPIVAQTLQALLDVCVRLSSFERDTAVLCAECLGIIGCLDPTRVELLRADHTMIVGSNFKSIDETVDFIVVFLEEVLVKAFLASMSPRSQNFLGYAMQNLLEICNFKPSNAPRGLEENQHPQKWMSISEEARNVLTPFLSSRYTLLEGNAPDLSEYPIFSSNKSHADWLRELVYDLLRKTQGDNANLVFGVCRRVVRGQDISIASFLLPYIALNILVGGGLHHAHEIGLEFQAVMIHPMEGLTQSAKDNLILSSQDVFRTLDYFSRWVHQKKVTMAKTRLPADDLEEAKMAVQIIEGLTSSIPAMTMSQRAVECKNFSRGLFYWEQYIRQWKGEHEQELQDDPQKGDFLYQRLQDIYVQIDEPDGIEGVSSYLQLLDAEQQVLEYRKAGRWTAVQDWNELLLADEPNNSYYQDELMTSLRESGQYKVLLDQASAFEAQKTAVSLSQNYIIEACWSTSQWSKLASCVPKDPLKISGGFVPRLGAAFVALYNKEYDAFNQLISELRVGVVRSLSKSSIVSLQSCREVMLQLHALQDIEDICNVDSILEFPPDELGEKLPRRLDVLGAFPSDQQYLLGLRRAAMELSNMMFSKQDFSSSWLTSARLYRKQNATSQAFKATLHASQLGDPAATMEHARLLWKEGHHRKAIQCLEGSIAGHAFEGHAVAAVSFDGDTALNKASGHDKHQNIMAAKAQLLRAKWLDRAGQTQSDSIIRQYQEACSLYTRWEKGQYNLGRHYNKVLESERLKPPGKQSQPCITGELAKHVIENFLRSMAYGAKYIYQTLPRILTLWCELGTTVDQNLESKYGTDESFRTHVMKHRKMFFDATVSQLKKYIDRLPAFVFYTAFNQICARICHTNAKVYSGLTDIVVKVCVSHPQQALWTLFAMVRSTAKDRMQRGQACLARIQEHAKRLKNEGGAVEIKLLISQGTKITEQLLEVCNVDLRKFPKRQSKVSIKDMNFSHRQASASKLVIPVETTLTASLPTATDTVNMRQHRAFSKETITIQNFQDEVLLLSSLIRPRKVDIRGSDGNIYGILCKPKDDLRLDQRLLEFNAMIKRLLKKDAESTKRRLYVKTYAVTPLNEECGLIEWVEGLKTHRDVLLKLYQAKGISPDYRLLGTLLEEAISEDLSKFTETILGMFPPVLHEWFVETFPDPEAWYTARLRYTRSCAVSSVVGHVLGLGDRHSENILIEEGNGGIMHVDFNCLFDKGLTFEKPEKVPFRLTGNMVDAFGAYGYEGPFRKGGELTMAILRQHEDTLMTVLEQFLYDPTIELMGGRRRRGNVDVPNTPEGVLESVRNKVRGLLPKEAIPLSVEGYVEFLVQQARDPVRLASMYIGWCAFL